MSEHVKVSIVVEIDDTTREFQAVTTTNGDPNIVASGLVQGLADAADEWLREQRRQTRGF